MNKKKAMIYNVLFLAVAAAILIFLWNAPPETTVRVPRDEDHFTFYNMGKKEAEGHCPSCHGKGGIAPLPETHPKKYKRCLFCHKKKE